MNMYMYSVRVMWSNVFRNIDSKVVHSDMYMYSMCAHTHTHTLNFRYTYTIHVHVCTCTSMCVVVYTCISFFHLCTCSFGDGQYRCPRAVSTALCVHDVQCLDPECKGHGVCEGTQCSCDVPWTGVTCDTLNCSATDCSGHGNCTDGTYMCTCTYMYICNILSFVLQ